MNFYENIVTQFYAWKKQWEHVIRIEDKYLKKLIQIDVFKNVHPFIINLGNDSTDEAMTIVDFYFLLKMKI